jgi:hypothetical protein
VGALAVAFAGDVGRAATQPGCSVRRANDSYTAAVARATADGRDVWGARLLALPHGPSYEAARNFLAPVLYGQKRGKQPLTSSGVHYLAFTYPRAAGGARGYGLHVADGSEVITRRLGGPRFTVSVGGAQRERFGACVGRLTPARLADGYLPVLRTAYVDRGGVVYRQESFLGRLPGVHPLVSLVRLDADARRSRTGAVVSFRPSTRGRAAGDRFVTAKGVRLIVGGGARFRDGAFRLSVPPGSRRVVHALWIHAPSKLPPRVQASAATYAAVRRTVVRYWERRLEDGARFSVPERVVDDARAGLLVQQLVHVWRYSVGNPYEELSFAEALDTAEVMAAYGFADVAREILEVALDRLPRRFTSWRAAEVFLGVATYHRLTGDGAFVREHEAALRRTLRTLEARVRADGTCAGRLAPERLCSDLGDPVDSLVANVVAVQALHAAGDMWRRLREPQLAGRASAFARRLDAVVAPAVRRSLVTLPDGSIFVPESLDGRRVPYRQLMETRDGSYWNLVVPYALASGYFPAGTPQARAIVRYLLEHGSRLLGVTRADAHVVYPRHTVGSSGLAPVYGLSASRFLADNDQPGQLVLSLYGQLAVGMTQGTYVSGEGVSVTPKGSDYHRTMYLPPNAGANSTFLETLRLLLVHERRNRRGLPVALDLAFATPRRWLGPGKTIRVERAPTSFGRLSFSIARRGDRVTAVVDVPARAEQARLRLRLPAGERLRSVVANGRAARYDARTGTVNLSGSRGRVTISATVRL